MYLLNPAMLPEGKGGEKQRNLSEMNHPNQTMTPLQVVNVLKDTKLQAGGNWSLGEVLNNRKSGQRMRHSA